jgi:hypothetical protein
MSAQILRVIKKLVLKMLFQFKKFLGFAHFYFFSCTNYFNSAILRNMLFICFLIMLVFKIFFIALLKKNSIIKKLGADHFTSKSLYI